MGLSSSLFSSLHASSVFPRRISRLAGLMSPLYPKSARVLDIGCGDGTLLHLINQQRPDLNCEGIDVLVRPVTKVPVALFDGVNIPHADSSFDAVMFVDVLHHIPDPMPLLREARRVTKGPIIIKDHYRDGLLANQTLKLMDWVGNAQHGVALPYNYWSSRQWNEAISTLGLRRSKTITSLGLYPWYANWLFGRGLHFIAVLEK